MSPAKAIVTLTVGPDFRERWERLCAPGWRAYAERHDYDLLVLDTMLDTSARGRSRSPAWQKCLVLGQPLARDYERVVWVDCDILINPRAPCVSAGVPAGRVGAVDEYATPSPERHREALAKLYAHWQATATQYVDSPRARDYYAAAGLPGHDAVVQTGVLVLEPANHRALLEATYYGYEDRGAGWNYEMRALSHELLQADLVWWLDPRFNFLWGTWKALHRPQLIARPDDPRALEAVQAALGDVHFLHFAGSAGEMTAPAVPAVRAIPPHAARRRGASATRDASVLMLIHRRPATTARVLEVIRTFRPRRLLVAADGSRDPEEAELCVATRALLERVDWPCEIEADFAVEHLGIRRRIESALDWAFERVEDAIVLEDDCVPDPTFFPFCAELLERFRSDPRVLSICGSDFAWHAGAGPASYRFSRYPLVWGWATWRRAWSLYDPAMAEWPAIRDDGRLRDLLGDARAVAYWTHILDREDRDPENWDYRWQLTGWALGGVHVHPLGNLVSNVGFGPDATHTPADHGGIFAGLATEPIATPLRHPPEVAPDGALDAELEDLMFSGNVTRMLARVRAARRAQEA